MTFDLSELIGFFWISVAISVAKAFFEKKEGEKMFSINMIFEILILTIIFQITHWIFS